MNTEAAKLYEAANRAAADAIRYSRQANGRGLSARRAIDARSLRALARLALRGQDGQ